MFLSNSRKYFLSACLIALLMPLLFAACGSSPGNGNKAVEVKVATNNEFPFPVKEAEVYQGNFVVTSGGVETRWFVARDNNKNRTDTIEGGVMVSSQVRNGELYLIDHRTKTYVSTSGDPLSAGQTGGIDSLTANLFKGKEYREFEDLGAENGTRKFKVKTDAASKGSIIMHIDEKSGMMVRQEFRESDDPASPLLFLYEIRDLKFEADASLFAIPDGYRKVERTEGTNNKK